MILHLASDEKFIDDAINLFETINPGQNKFIIGVGLESDGLKYIKNQDKVQIGTYGSKQYKKLIGNISSYDAVIVHFLDRYKAEVIISAPESVKFVWMIWGGDAYKLIAYNVYDDNTSDVLKKTEQENWFKEIFRKLFLVKSLILCRRKFKSKKLYAAIKRFRYCTTVIPNEYQLFTKSLPLKSSYIPFNYSGIDFSILNTFKKNANSFNNIIVGNSGSPTNNHITIFRKLGNGKSGLRKVIVPLNYGQKAYIEEVIKVGTNILKDTFSPLTEFIPFPEYVKILSSCSVCIMNHYRQQGMGNIIMILWFGAKLYLRKENPVFQYLTENKIKVFSLNDEELTFDNLTEEEKVNNRLIIEKLYDPKLIEKKAINLVRLLTTVN